MKNRNTEFSKKIAVLSKIPSILDVKCEILVFIEYMYFKVSNLKY